MKRLKDKLFITSLLAFFLVLGCNGSGLFQKKPKYELVEVLDFDTITTDFDSSVHII